MTSQFYADYLQHLENSSNDSPGLIPYLISRNDVDPEYIKHLDAMTKEALKENPEVGLDYDPILMAQDWPSKMAYGTPLVKGNAAWVVANRVWGEEPSLLCVTLTKKNGTWLISGVADLDDGQSSEDCGGAKTNGFRSK